jgi:hypothetical protein
MESVMAGAMTSDRERAEPSARLSLQNVEALEIKQTALSVHDNDRIAS